MGTGGSSALGDCSCGKMSFIQSVQYGFNLSDPIKVANEPILKKRYNAILHFSFDVRSGPS